MKKKGFIFLFLVFLVLLILFYPIDVLRLNFNEKTVFYTPILSNLNVEVCYTHSVSLTKVVDCYAINNSGIFAVKTKWQDFEAGQPLDGYIENSFFVKDLNSYLGKNWEYWFIPLNNVSVKINGKNVFSNPKDEGILMFEVSKTPLGEIALRWCK